MLEKAVQAAIYEKALKNHYIEILYIDFEDTGKCIKLHQDAKLLNGENIFPESDEQMFDDYICEKIMRYASGDVEDLKRVKQQMTMEAITQGTAEHIMHHVMINFMLNGEMRFMQFDFTRESKDTKNVFLFVENYTDPQQQAFITTLRSIKNSAVLFCVLSEEADAKTTQQTERENRYSGKKVLLVEDNELNREIATALLEEIGISVDSVEDGTDAVERMNEVDDDRYDLIFMDIQMPKMDGYMTTREIRTLKNNRKANIPIVAMTANAFEEDKKKAFKAGMNAHVAKPIDIKTILAVFDQVFGNL